MRLLYHRILAFLVTALLIAIGWSGSAEAATDAVQDTPVASKNVGPVRTDLSQLNRYNRVHRRSNIWMNITNYGYFGNSGENAGGMDDPCRPGEWAPQAEYPGGSDIQYLFQGGLWLGALIRGEGFEYPRVSVGLDGWMTTNEFQPGVGATYSQENGIIERSTLPLQFDCLGNAIGQFQDQAVSEQDFLVQYTDTLTENFYVDNDPIDGPHIPLGIKITQKSYTWTYNYAQNFIIIDWEIENIAGNYLKNLYVGLYMDADVGKKGNTNRHTDDICGFQQWFYYTRPDGQPDSSVINTAYIADNDGRNQNVSSGTNFEAPGVMGTRVVRAPNPKLRTSFNWWISNGDADLDFGPAWEDDGAPGGWTDTYGTPMGDEKKYFVLSNGEFDYDQVYVNDADWIKAHPQVITDRWTHLPIETHKWKVPGETDKTPPDFTKDLANGYDTRYLLSWGPLGIFDHIDEAGNRIYRLNPGEKFSMTVAIVAGDNFHDRNNPQPDNENIDPSRFNFTSLRYNADWAARVYDNPMIDTPLYDWGNDHDPNVNDADGSQGDGILETGDGWFGEDVGEDGLFAEKSGEPAYRWEGGVRVQYTYPGPDEGENDGHLSPTEDALERPLELDYTRLNEQLDFGDGYPDFKGPPPPDAPQLESVDGYTQVVIDTTGGHDSLFTIDDNFLTTHVVLKWNEKPSEISEDPFSREIDFEGYRIYVSNTFTEKDFTFVDQFDRVDYSLFSDRDSMAAQPVTDPNDLPAEDYRLGVHLVRKGVGPNIGFKGHQNLLKDIHGNYYYILSDAHPMIPRYYSVTAYDYGDYKTGTQSLESARIANAIYRAPSGIAGRKVGVVPNPYRANLDYTTRHGGISWENRDDGTSDFFPQTDRRIYFYNLPEKCMIRIYTVSGDLVTTIPHNLPGDDNIVVRGQTTVNSIGWSAFYAEPWDLNSRNKQQVVAGLYLFTVENSETGSTETGKFVVIR